MGMSDINTDWGPLLWGYMQAQGVSQMDVVRRLEAHGAERVSKGYVSARLNGVRPLTSDIMNAVAELLGMSQVQILAKLIELVAAEQERSAAG